MEAIYFDNAATTRTEPEVLEAMLPYFVEEYGNPSSLHEYGLHAKKAVSEARMTIAELLGCKPNEIFFTSGGTEADNWAIKGTCLAREAGNAEEKSPGHIVTTAIEHHAVLHTCRFLEKRGYAVTYLPVDELGRISLTELANALRPDTFLISVMYANNEVGTVQPVGEIAELARQRGVAFHTDAVQAAGHFEEKLSTSGITFLSASAHKFGGPKGVGFLYVREGTKLVPLLHGGAQEQQMRSGTENVPGIVGMAKALELTMKKRREREKKVAELRDYFAGRLLAEIPMSRRNGDPEECLSGNLNMSFAGVQASSLLVFLDMAGIHCSSGSACTSASSGASHVLLAMGLSDQWINGSVRMTLSEHNTKEQVDYAVEKMREFVAKLRDQNPAWKK